MRPAAPLLMAAALVQLLALLLPSPAHAKLGPPPSPPRKTSPGELWSAFWLFNSTNQCATDSSPVLFAVARWTPSAGNVVPGSSYSLSFPFLFQNLLPMHSKTITGAGSVMAVDSVGRRGWAMLGTTDWSPHVWIVALSFPGGPSTQAVATGVCELVNASSASYAVINQIGGGLQYNPAISTKGPWFVWSAQYGMGNTSIASITVPPLKPGPPPSTIPPCGVTNVSYITDPTFSPFQLPPPALGTTASGKPVVMSLATSTTNTSQTNLTVWSAATGQRIYGPQTFACGYPSYLYTCPPTTGANWPMAGLFGFYMSNGTLVAGGGDWSGQQYFMGAVPLKEEGEADRDGEGHGQGEGQVARQPAALDGIPVLTFLNSSSDQGTWLAGPHTSLFVPRAGKWPVSLQFIAGVGGTCVQPTYQSLVVMGVPSSDGTVVNNTLSGGSIAPGCPIAPGALPWSSTAVCGGASVGYPDLVTGVPH
jgi:hypothetical protein